MPWQPTADVANLRLRAQILRKIREFFDERGYLEVETPVLARCGVTDAYLSNIKTQIRGVDYYLQTSPEYHMKRLLAAGSGAIYQLARVFRDDELGRHHNIEFSLLEWYRPSFDHFALMAEVDVFLQHMLACPAAVQKTYQQVFLEYCAVDPFSCSLSDLKNTLNLFQLNNILPEDEEDLDQYLFLLMSHIVEPALARVPAPVFIYHFPKSQAALAKIEGDYAERFEVYINGIELANGFHELTDFKKQQQRFAADLALRSRLGLPIVPQDDFLLAALQHGLPQCSGVALGLDRLLMVLTKAASIEEVMSFSFANA